jgi:hypothetical protein
VAAEAVVGAAEAMKVAGGAVEKAETKAAALEAMGVVTEGGESDGEGGGAKVGKGRRLSSHGSRRGSVSSGGGGNKRKSMRSSLALTAQMSGHHSIPSELDSMWHDRCTIHHAPY